MAAKTSVTCVKSNNTQEFRPWHIKHPQTALLDWNDLKIKGYDEGFRFDKPVPTWTNWQQGTSKPKGESVSVPIPSKTRRKAFRGGPYQVKGLGNMLEKLSLDEKARKRPLTLGKRACAIEDIIDVIDQKISQMNLGGSDKPNTQDEAVQPQAHSSAVEPNAYYNAVQPQAHSSAVEPNAYYNAVQPQAYYYAVQPQAYYNAVQPQAYYNAVQPQAYYNAVQSQAYYNAVQPQAYYNAVQPQAYYNAVQPQAHSNAVKPQAHSNAVQRKAHSNAVQRKARSNAVQPKATSNAVQPLANSNAVKLQAHSNAVQAQAYSSAVQAQAHSNAVQAQAHSNAVQPQAHSNAVQPEAHSKAVQRKARSNAVQAQAHSNTVQARAHSNAVQAQAHSNVVQAQAHSNAVQPHSNAVQAQAHSNAVQAQAHSNAVQPLAHCSPIQRKPSTKKPSKDEVKNPKGSTEKAKKVVERKELLKRMAEVTKTQQDVSAKIQALLTQQRSEVEKREREERREKGRHKARASARFAPKKNPYKYVAQEPDVVDVVDAVVPKAEPKPVPIRASRSSMNITVSTEETRRRVRRTVAVDNTKTVGRRKYQPVEAEKTLEVSKVAEKKTRNCPYLRKGERVDRKQRKQPVHKEGFLA